MDDEKLVNSSLSQFVTRDERTVKVEIYRDDKSGWILEVVDEYGNSTVWDDAFESERHALDVALETIDKEGIAALIGEPSQKRAMTMSAMSPMSRPGISQADLMELEDFLGSPACTSASMDIAALDGYLTAVVIGPRLIMPSEWLRWIWDRDEGEEKAAFDSAEQASRIMSIVMHHYNSIAQTFAATPASFEPLYWSDIVSGAEQWCTGFMLGYQLESRAWSLLCILQPAWFTPFLRLGTEEGSAITVKTDDAERWRAEIVPCLLNIYGYWKRDRGSGLSAPSGSMMNYPMANDVTTVIHAGPKIGRNESCPCGSGKKFKKCCNLKQSQSPLH